jgi:hypothetical protein
MSRWKTDARGPYTRAAGSGRKAYLLHPEVEDYNVVDVVLHAVGIRRFNGAGMSIAQHMVVGAAMAQMFYPDDALLPHRFLIHDIAETKLGDVSSPLKHLLGAAYRDLEQAHELVVEKKFGTLFIGDERVKELDNRMFLTERLEVYRGLDVDVSEDVAGLDLEPFPLSKADMEEFFEPWDTMRAAETYSTALRIMFGVRTPSGLEN